jgi:manganese/zinc/iron transport system permease protein
LAAPRRGLVARVLARRSDGWRADREEILRLLYEFAEAGADGDVARLHAAKSWSSHRVRTLVADLERTGDVVSNSLAYVALTDTGRAKAAEVVRRHRLWRLLITEYPDLVSLARPLTGEAVEDTLTAEVVDDLTNRLRAAGRWPSVAPAASSVTGGAS